MGVEMKPDKNMKLADLMYGHGSKFMCSLSGRFDPKKYPGAPPIQICEMKYGCWIVADGNNRVGLILKKNPEATIADISERLVATARFGEWDDETMDWWNPCPKSFREVMSNRGKKAPAPKNAIYGIIERDEEGKFIASTHALKGVAPSAIGHTADEAKRLLENKLKILLGKENVSLVLTPMTPLEDHQCSLSRPVGN
jgi:predicted RNase H-like HicB family nuclease